MIILEMLPFKWACECLHHLHYKSYALCMHARKQELAGSLLSTAAELAQRQSLPSRQRFNMCHAIILTQLRQGRRAACTASCCMHTVPTLQRQAIVSNCTV